MPHPYKISIEDCVRRATRNLVLAVEDDDSDAINQTLAILASDLHDRFPGTTPRNELRRVRREAAVLGGALVGLTIRHALYSLHPQWQPALTNLLDANNASQLILADNHLALAFVPLSFDATSPIPPSKRPMVPDADNDARFDLYVRTGLAVLFSAYDGTEADWNRGRPTLPSLKTVHEASMQMLETMECRASFRYGELAEEQWSAKSAGEDPSLQPVNPEWSDFETSRLLTTMHHDAKSSESYSRQYLTIRFVGQLRDAYSELQRQTSGTPQERMRFITHEVSSIAARSTFDRYAISKADKQSRLAGHGRARILPSTNLKHGGCPGAANLGSSTPYFGFHTLAEQLTLLSALICVPTAWNASRGLEQSHDRVVVKNHFGPLNDQHFVCLPGDLH